MNKPKFAVIGGPHDGGILKPDIRVEVGQTFHSYALNEVHCYVFCDDGLWRYRGILIGTIDTETGEVNE